YNKDIWFGVAANHMNTPNVSVLNSVSRVPMKITAHLGARLQLHSGPRTLERVSYLTPSLIFRSQGPINQFDMGMNYHIDPVSVGVWYRGKFWQKSVIGSINQDALVFTMGLYMKNFTVGYSYDFSISSLSTTSGGAHEISLMYEFVAK